MRSASPSRDNQETVIHGLCTSTVIAGLWGWNVKVPREVLLGEKETCRVTCSLAVKVGQPGTQEALAATSAQNGGTAHLLLARPRCDRHGTNIE